MLQGSEENSASPGTLYTHARTLTRTHARTHTRVHTCTHVHTRTLTCTHMCARAHARTPTVVPRAFSLSAAVASRAQVRHILPAWALGPQLTSSEHVA